MAFDPVGEQQRLHALNRYEVLDSLPETEFNRITRLVAAQLQVPIAFINFIDESRGWFKAVHGTLVRQQERHMGVCTHTIEQPDVMVIPDFALDSRFQHQDIRFGDIRVQSYIGAPLITPDGHRIGTLSAVDAAPRSFTADQRTLLRDLAAVVIDELELRLAIRNWREADRRSSHAAHHDALTGLPNRAHLLDHAERAAQHARRTKTHVALLMMDLDHFKHVNDSLGHHAGDALLCVVAARLAASVRSGDTVARLGGDEFVMLLGGLDDPLDAALIAQKILEQVRLPVDIEGHRLQPRGSIGIAVYPRDFQAVPDLLRAADIAMYHAKQRGGGQACFHTEQMSVEAAEKLHRHLALEVAAQRGAFELYYQPQVDLHSRQVIGVEALLRWPRPDGTVESPDAFIPLAERSRLILPIGAWVLQEACAQLQHWRHAGRPTWKVAVNVSAEQWNAPDFVRQVVAALDLSGLPPECLVLELTESHVISSPSAARDVLATLNALRVQVALDDFGMGYSNLSQLAQLSFQQLKLDRSLIASMTTDRRYAALVRNSINLARDLDVSVVGEGVESQLHLDLLTAWGCAVGQGFLFGRPAPAAAYRDELDSSESSLDSGEGGQQS
ncbi:EAL domain-containing protein (plasmid) [Deinococcus taeanensis]|uniref:putative bifunctional diguanylate cyclase/phosphodiesterase n=1 Tax=Deinococcus taeanensis TaxID=2737050 RepID=UPI001CDBB005|nr:EAL domain-containing protein [Deinococcus taeanensis]UBV45406.1 EAL domain-containing protein [Deinococcus taeanensis]